MKLRQIDKNRYSKHYKIVFAAIVIALIAISLVSSTLLISWLSSPDESHFILNLAGVLVAVFLVLYAMYRYRDHPFMDEVVYVWNLKKQLNLIYRKQHKIEPLIEDNNVDAMVIMNYMYQGSKQLYELDDNTITMSDLAIKARRLNTKLEEKGLKLTTDDYYSGLLDQF
jgi:tellurite resistance protein TehA-like permease